MVRTIITDHPNLDYIGVLELSSQIIPILPLGLMCYSNWFHRNHSYFCLMASLILL